MKIAAIILAAGESRRMGSPKQLLPYQGSNLLTHAFTEARLAFGDHTFIVLGANAKEIAAKIPVPESQLIINPNWQSGMASSIKAGLVAVCASYPDPDAVLIMTGDQPYVTGEHLHNMVKIFEKNHPGIVASAYAGIMGVPAIFSKTIFAGLMKLNADTGARYIIQQQLKTTIAVPLPEGSIDIDTPEQYQKLIIKQ